MTICNRVAESLLLFRDGDLSPEQMQFLREHLQYCPACLDLLNGYDEVIEILERLRPVNMPEDLLERMKQRIKEQAG